MTERYLRTGYKVRIKDMSNNDARKMKNVLQSHYNWLFSLLESEGVDLTNMNDSEAKHVS